MELNMFKSKNHTYFELTWTCLESSNLLVQFEKSASTTSCSRRKRPNDADERLDEMSCGWMTFL